MTSPLETLPPELFRSILAYLSPEDTSSLSQTCHRMNIVTRDDEIWRQYFFKKYITYIYSFLNFSLRYTYSSRTLQYTDEEYLPNSAFKPFELPNGSTWQEYFIQKSLQDKHIRSLLNEIISSRTNRMK